MSPTKGKLHKWLSEQGAIGALAFAPQGDLLVTAGRDLRFWRTKKRQLLLTLDQRSAPIRDVRFSADGQLLLAAGEDQRALLWNLDDYYYRICVDEVPHTKLARDCFYRLANQIYFGFTGSSGTSLPKAEEERLKKIRGLAE